MTNYQDIALTGYRRENGQVGIRNYVLVMSVDDISNAAVTGVESLVRGTLGPPRSHSNPSLHGQECTRRGGGDVPEPS